jgi:hypothetical protein
VPDGQVTPHVRRTKTAVGHVAEVGGALSFFSGQRKMIGWDITEEIILRRVL